MKTITVSLPDTSYNILIDAGLLTHTGEHIVALPNTHNNTEKIVIVSDTNVWGLYGKTLALSLQATHCKFTTVVLPAGEGSKTLAGLEQVYAALAKAELGRGDLIVALGGGVIGDLAGFAAATWMRGIAYVQIPTSMLAQVDSSVGGKTAIDLACGKNLVGAFHQPRLVLADTQLLDTLPATEFACGMAEVIKYGAIKSKVFFEQLSSPTSAPSLEAVVETCCTIKRDIVQRDERDHGERALLNFGHTLGHAVETLGGYARFSHGAAVAIGMVLAAQLGENLGITAPDCADKLRQTLVRWQLPTQCPYQPQALLEQVALDKKRTGDSIHLVLLKTLGEALVVPLALNELAEQLEVCVHV